MTGFLALESHMEKYRPGLFSLIGTGNELIMNRSSCQKLFNQQVVLNNFTKFTGKHVCLSLFLENPTPVFSFEFLEIVKNAFSTEHLRVTASVSDWLLTEVHRKFPLNFNWS